MMNRNTVTVLVAALLAFGAYHEGQSRLHIGAPHLPYHCSHGQYVKRWWVPESSPEGAGASGTLVYHGWREIASCASSLTADT